MDAFIAPYQFYYSYVPLQRWRFLANTKHFAAPPYPEDARPTPKQKFLDPPTAVSIFLRDVHKYKKAAPNGAAFAFCKLFFRQRFSLIL